MPLPSFQPTTPPFDIVRAAHAEHLVTDLEAARRFYVDLLGLVVTTETDDAVYLRGWEERVHHSLVLRRGDDDLVGHLAFRTASDTDLDALADHYTALGCEPAFVEDVEVGQGRALRVQDPQGFPLEYFCEMDRAERMLQRYDLDRKGELQRIDHFNLHVPSPAEAFAHYQTMGFRCSEYIHTEAPAADAELVAAWLYRKPNVHDLALMSGTGPRVHHIAYWVSTPTDILRTCDTLAAAGFGDAIERGPGRHGLSNAFFLYLRDPAGHRLELYTSDYFTGDPDFDPIGWSNQHPQVGTFWGHRAPDSWFDESSRVRRLGSKAEPVAVRAADSDERPHSAI